MVPLPHLTRLYAGAPVAACGNERWRGCRLDDMWVLNPHICPCWSLARPCPCDTVGNQGCCCASPNAIIDVHHRQTRSAGLEHREQGSNPLPSQTISN